MIRFGALVAAAVAVLAGGARQSARPVPPFTHVVVIVFENHDRDEVIGSKDAPYLNELARRYADLGRYEAVTHPSLPNYLALVSGSTQGITDDCDDCVVHARNLADTLAAAHLTWKAYAEDLPYRGYTGASKRPYVKHHVPFVYFADVLDSAARRMRIVPLIEFATDLRARLPSFALVIPNNCHNMHDCSVSDGDSWLRSFLPPVLASPFMKRGVVFVVFDEGKRDAPNGGEVAAVAAGPTVKPGSHPRGATGHYALLRTIEDAWGLPSLGASAHAAPITGIWKGSR